MSSVALLFTTYLIYPILGIVLGLVAVLIAKKNGLLKNKRLIVYTLLSLLVLVVPALLGFLDYDFMPYGYISLTLTYLVLGWYNNRLIGWVFNKEDIKFRARIGYIIFQLLVGLLLFSLVFNFCCELKYGLWAATSMLSFILPPLLVRSYNIFIHIPALIYKVWTYDSARGYAGADDIDHNKLKVVSVELFKQESDTDPIRINAKVPDTMLLGDWIKLLFQDYNKRSAHSPINVRSEEGEGWIFYIKSNVLFPKRYLDYELTVEDNRIKEKHLIVAKRVKQVISEE